MLTTERRPVEILTQIAQECSVDQSRSLVERRESPRFLLRIPVVCAELDDEFQQVSEFISARTLNVSTGGVLLASPQQLTSSIISVTFCDWEGVPYELTARVVHQDMKDGEFLTGAEFIVPGQRLSE